MPVHDEDVHQYHPVLLPLVEPVFQLVSVVLADKELRQRQYSGFDNLAHYSEAHTKPTVMRLAVEVATTYRLIHWNARTKPKTSVVGRLCEDQAAGTWTDLTMIEACHKVIHAETFAFEQSRLSRPRYSSYMKPRLHLTGSKGRKHWCATIEVVAFGDAALEPLNAS